MSSQAQVAANRQNGRRSRGPRTAAGKLSASRNARRHGLAAINRHNPACFPEIERIARAYCEGDTDPLLFEAALMIAENDVILMAVHTERLAAIARMRDPEAIPFSQPKASLARARARFAQAQRLYAELAAAKARAAHDTPAKHSHGLAQEPHVPVHCDEFDAMLRAEPDLRRLERYARRAASRRKRAIREFIFIRSLREFQRQGEGRNEDELVMDQQDYEPV